MIMMDLKVPIQAIQCIALMRNLPKIHSKRPQIEKDLKAWLKGYYGEKYCKHYLSLLPEDQYYIFHGLRLQDRKKFQMDLLLLSQFFALIFEIKNYSGTLCFDQHSKHVTRIFDGHEEGVQNPILQVKRHHYQFKNILIKKQLKSLPIISMVMISKTSTKIHTTDADIFNDLIYSEALLEKIKELEITYQTPHLSKKKLVTLADTLLQEHRPFIPNILKTYRISPTELPTGVHCPKCKRAPMIYVSGTWHCTCCKYTSKTAHIQTVDDYFLLQSAKITRKQFQVLLQMDSPTIARNLLLSLKLPSKGTKRGTTYHLPKDRIFTLPEEDLFE